MAIDIVFKLISGGGRSGQWRTWRYGASAVGSRYNRRICGVVRTTGLVTGEPEAALALCPLTKLSC
jgi:hypothetical protein